MIPIRLIVAVTLFSYYRVVTVLRYVLLFLRPLVTTNADLTLTFSEAEPNHD